MMNSKNKILYCCMALLFTFNIYADDSLVPPIIALNNSKPAEYTVIFSHDTLKSALSKYAKSHSLQVDYDSEFEVNLLSKTVSGEFKTSSNTEILDILARRFGFSWFIFNGILYVSPLKKYTRNFYIAADQMDEVIELLEQQGVLSRNFGFITIKSQNKIIVTGPKQYLSILADLINQFDVLPSDQQIAVFHLKYASATDLQFSFNNQTINVPGIASILQGVLQGKDMKNTPVSSSVINKIASPLAGDKNESQQSSSSGSNSANNNSKVSNPIIQADARLNTVIIRDKKANMSIYNNLIEVLDVASPLIEIDVLVVRLNDTLLNENGVNWWASNGTMGIGYGTSGLSTSGLSSSLSAYYGQVYPGQLLINNSANFIASLEYLEQHEVAQAVSRPSIVTTDNLPALVSLNDSVYVNTSSQYSSSDSSSSGSTSTGSSLQQVQVVTALQVTPHIVNSKGGKKEIKLSVSLQDGAIINDITTNMPETLQGSINSQAVITDGQSLLLAGYTKDQMVSIVKKVPFLGDIPVLGWFFSNKSEVQQKFTTVYLIMPKIIWSGDFYNIKDFVMVGDKKIDSQTYDSLLKKNNKDK